MMINIDDKNDIFVYKLTVDNGGAPCLDRENNLLSLCICKPNIRKFAKKNDWIIGMGGKSVPELKDRLIYIAKVTSVLENGKYYQEDEYKKRADCIYELVNGKYRRKKNFTVYPFHKEDSENLSHDLGQAPDYDRAVCLVSDKFVYFGNGGSDRTKKPNIESIQDIYDDIPRDYRKNHDEAIRKRLIEFINKIVEEFGYGKRGEPTHLDKSKKCSMVEDDGIMHCPKKC